MKKQEAVVRSRIPSPALSWWYGGQFHNRHRMYLRVPATMRVYDKFGLPQKSGAIDLADRSLDETVRETA